MMIGKEEIIRTLDALANWQGSLSLTDKERVALTFAVEYIKKHEETFEWCHDCKEYDQKNHCCHRWTNVIRDTVDELEKDRPHGEWIPCSERFPKPGKYVLVCSDEGNIEVANGYISTEIEEFVWLTSGWRFGEVIAWMPLPKPYRKEGDQNEQ